MRRRTLLMGGALALLAALAALAWGVLRLRERSAPERFTQGNLLYNADFAIPSPQQPELPDGWSVGAAGARLSDFLFQPGPGRRSMELYGTSNYLKSPLVAVQAGKRYRLGFRVLCENETPSRVRAWFHWLDAEGDEIRVEKQPWREAPARNWGLVLEELVAPQGAAQLAVSIHPAADDRLFIDTLALNVAGVRVLPWPEGRAAALSFSVDWETVMGGLLHSRTGDPASEAGRDPIARGLRMRAGTHQLLELLRPHNVRATWFANGYNFLLGNREGRSFLGNPTFSWATAERRWPGDHWAETPWFAADPHGTYESHPAWYFGDLVPQLGAANQAIESHTFSHFYGGFASVEQWRGDLQAWNSVAAEQGVDPARVLAFPWSGSDGMTEAKWRELLRAGITAVTRTSENRPYRIAHDDLLIPRPHPGFEELLVFPDAYLTPDSVSATLELINQAAANGGALDIWAHTEEVTAPEQVAAWRTVLEVAVGRGDLWIAPLSEIAAWWRNIRQVEARMIAAGPPLRLLVQNHSPHDLQGIALQLPVRAQRAEAGGQPVGRIVDDTLIIDLAAQQTLEVAIWPAL